jgi:hypothetical protein
LAVFLEDSSPYTFEVTDVTTDRATVISSYSFGRSIVVKHPFKIIVTGRVDTSSTGLVETADC